MKIANYYYVQKQLWLYSAHRQCSNTVACNNPTPSREAQRAVPSRGFARFHSIDHPPGSSVLVHVDVHMRCGCAECKGDARRIALELLIKKNNAGVSSSSLLLISKKIAINGASTI
jgi:hypothetical protein